MPHGRSGHELAGAPSDHPGTNSGGGGSCAVPCPSHTVAGKTPGGYHHQAGTFQLLLSPRHLYFDFSRRIPHPLAYQEIGVRFPPLTKGVRGDLLRVVQIPLGPPLLKGEGKQCFCFRISLNRNLLDSSNKSLYINPQLIVGKSL